jgi:hypothetical protein
MVPFEGFEDGPTGCFLLLMQREAASGEGRPLYFAGRAARGVGGWGSHSGPPAKRYGRFKQTQLAPGDNPQSKGLGLRFIGCFVAEVVRTHDCAHESPGK